MKPTQNKQVTKQPKAEIAAYGIRTQRIRQVLVFMANFYRLSSLCYTYSDSHKKLKLMSIISGLVGQKQEYLIIQNSWVI